tara:strand:+ start:418 stop:657 length:240 start_codon:yes stop_codon:yes gene_type:complete
MENKLKRYVVKMDMYVYAENDYMARKRAHKLSKTLNTEKYNTSANVIEIGEQEFGTMEYYKLDNHTEPADREDKADLPF